jgi:hypothetical protein
MASPSSVIEVVAPERGVVDAAYLENLVYGSEAAAAEAEAVVPAEVVSEAASAPATTGSALENRMALAVMRHADRSEQWRGYRHEITEARRADALENPTRRNRMLVVGALALETVGGLALATLAFRMGAGAATAGDVHFVAADTDQGEAIAMDTVAYEVEPDPNAEPTTFVLPEWNEDTGEGSIWNEMPNIAAILGYPDIPADIQDGLADFVRAYNDNMSEGEAEGIKQFTMPPRNELDAELQRLGAEFDITTAEPGTPRNPVVEVDDPAPEAEEPELKDPIVLPPHFEEPSLWEKHKDTIIDTALLVGGVAVALTGIALLARAFRGRRPRAPQVAAVPARPGRRLVGGRDRRGGRVGGGPSAAPTAMIEAAALHGRRDHEAEPAAIEPDETPPAVGTAQAPGAVEPTPAELAEAAAATGDDPTDPGVFARTTHGHTPVEVDPAQAGPDPSEPAVESAPTSTNTEGDEIEAAADIERQGGTVQTGGQGPDEAAAGETLAPPATLPAPGPLPVLPHVGDHQQVDVAERQRLAAEAEAAAAEAAARKEDDDSNS